MKQSLGAMKETVGPTLNPLLQAEQEARLTEEVEKAAFYLARKVRQDQLAAIRGELLSLGNLATPVLTVLSARLDDEERARLNAYLVRVLVTDDVPGKRSQLALSSLVSLVNRVDWARQDRIENPQKKGRAVRPAARAATIEQPAQAA